MKITPNHKNVVALGSFDGTGENDMAKVLEILKDLGNTKCPYNGSIRCGDGEKCYEGRCSDFS